MKQVAGIQTIIQRLIAKRVGLPKYQTLTVQGHSQALFGAELLQKHAQELSPIQNLDPNSADYGKFYFIAGYSVIGGDDIIP